MLPISRPCRITSGTTPHRPAPHIHGAAHTPFHQARRLYNLGFASYALALCCWISDIHFCDFLQALPPGNPQLCAQGTRLLSPPSAEGHSRHCVERMKRSA